MRRLAVTTGYSTSEDGAKILDRIAEEQSALVAFYVDEYRGSNQLPPLIEKSEYDKALTILPKSGAVFRQHAAMWAVGVVLGRRNQPNKGQIRAGRRWCKIISDDSSMSISIECPGAWTQCALSNEEQIATIIHDGGKPSTFLIDTANSTVRIFFDPREKTFTDKGYRVIGTYKNVYTPTLVECPAGHRVMIRADTLANNSGCWKCGRLSQSAKKILSHEEASARFESHGMRLLEQYRGTRISHLVECENGHHVRVRLGNLNGSGCRRCRRYTSEEACRYVFESVFSAEFSHARPKWLVNESGNRMEFDGYNANLGIAFEFHGRQHFEIDGHYTKTEEDVLITQHRDAVKRKLAQQNEVTLIEIAHYESLCTEDLRNKIFAILQECGKPIPPLFWSEIKPGRSSSKMEEARRLASEHGAVLLDKTWKHVDYKMAWQCQCGNQFYRSLTDARQLYMRCKSCRIQASRKLSVTDIMLVKSLKASGKSQIAIARHFGVSKQTINRVFHKRRYT